MVPANALPTSPSAFDAGGRTSYVTAAALWQMPADAAERVRSVSIALNWADVHEILVEFDPPFGSVELG